MVNNRKKVFDRIDSEIADLRRKRPNMTPDQEREYKVLTDLRYHLRFTFSGQDWFEEDDKQLLKKVYTCIANNVQHHSDYIAGTLKKGEHLYLSAVESYNQCREVANKLTIYCLDWFKELTNEGVKEPKSTTINF